MATINSGVQLKVYDCFCYFNEDLILELRLETLWDYVDYFVISEAVYTQVGDPKPLNFDLEKFSKYREKIRYLTVDHFPPGKQGFWQNENYQRNYLMNGLFDAHPDDLILVSDLDEIPRPELIKEYNPSKYKRGDFAQKGYAYLLNNLLFINGDQAIWQGSKITTYYYLSEFFKTVTAVRSYKSSGIFRSIKRAWFKKFSTQSLLDGGWHFSWMQKSERIVEKMMAIADQQAVRPEYKNLDYISQKIKAGEDLLNPSAKYIYEPVTMPNFPKFLVENKKIYLEWLRVD
jgi:beta-1,4-mannosyl-glycoprotein beta-1,4-N-acetylglucosaminyltransferase